MRVREITLFRCCVYVFCTLGMFLLCTACVFESYAASGLQSRSAYEDQTHGSWKSPGMRSANNDEFWEKGTSGNDLLRSSTEQGLQQPKATAPEVGPDEVAGHAGDTDAKEDISIAGGSIKGDATQLGPTWKGPMDRSLIIDENLKKEKHDVIGAYGEMLKSDDFEVRMGPEVYIPMGGAKAYQGDEKPDTTEIGVGMKFRWGF